jgi:hypothetical protein
MTPTQADPVRATNSPDHENDFESRVYTWYDPDAAAFGLDDPLAELEPLIDEDALATVDLG